MKRQVYNFDKFDVKKNESLVYTQQILEQLEQQHSKYCPRSFQLVSLIKFISDIGIG